MSGVFGFLLLLLCTKKSFYIVFDMFIHLTPVYLVSSIWCRVAGDGAQEGHNDASIGRGRPVQSSSNIFVLCLGRDIEMIDVWRTETVSYIYTHLTPITTTHQAHLHPSNTQAKKMKKYKHSLSTSRTSSAYPATHYIPLFPTKPIHLIPPCHPHLRKLTSFQPY